MNPVKNRKMQGKVAQAKDLIDACRDHARHAQLCCDTANRLLQEVQQELGVDFEQEMLQRAETKKKEREQ